MPVFKCKMCGGDLSYIENSTICECEYCGAKQTLPNSDNEKKINLFNRANRLRMDSEYDRASAVYENIVAEFPDEAEAYWGLCLCTYGIEYVDDPLTGMKIPTCHRTLPTSILDDSNYKQACDKADTSARVIYSDEAKKIDEIQKNILSIALNEAPYDVFICYKESNEAGGRTEDSVIAQEIYDALTAKGLKVFFSRITLEDKLGVQYEPYIYSALNSAKVMLAVGTSFDNFDAVWVKNEWSRYLHMMKSDSTKALIPCFKDLDAYDLPKEFKGLQAQDMSKIGWLQDLVRGVEKICGKSVKSQPATVVQQVVSSATNIEPLLKRAQMFLEDKNWKEAQEYCEKVLDQAPENATAYLYKLMAELQVSNADDLKNCQFPFDDNSCYQKVMRFGDETLKAKLNADIEFIKIRNQYNKAVQIMKSDPTSDKLLQAAKIFESITDFKDSAILEKECINKANEIKARCNEALKLAKEIETAESYKSDKSLRALNQELETLTTLASQFSSIIAECENLKANIDQLNQEKSALCKQKEQLGLFALKEKKNIGEKIDEIEKSISSQNSKMADYQSKLNGYTSLEKVNNRIEWLKKAITSKEFKNEKIKQLTALCNCTEINIIIKKDYPNYKYLCAKVGDYFTFGSYEQDIDTTNGKEDIEWLVLDKQDDKILIISKYALDTVPYNKDVRSVTWETCTLRKWLNNDFYNSAFNEEEKTKIKSSTVTADANPEYDTDPGNNTGDKVFLLSINEVRKYFSTWEARKCVPTDYAIAQGACVSDSHCWWWLRSPGYDSDYAARVYNDGDVYYYGYGVDDDYDCVRPALWIEI